MEQTAQKTEMKKLTKDRTIWTLIQVLLGIPAALMLFYYSPLYLRYFDKDAGSLGVQVLQAFVVAIVGVILMAAVAHVLAFFNQKQFREDAWNGKSRYAVLYRDYFWAGVALSAFLLGAMAALPQ